MKHKLLSGSLIAALLFAGCSSTPAAPNNPDGEQPNDVTVLQNVVDNAGEDKGCYTAWEELLQTTIGQMNNSYMLESDGAFYEYKDNQEQTFVEDDALYNLGRENIFVSGDSSVNVDMVDVDDSYDTLIRGYGIFDQYNSDGTVLTALDITSDDDDVIKGTVAGVENSEKVDPSSAAVKSMIDSLVNYGYVRYVDPIHNASLYNYDLKTTDDGYTLTMSIKDLDAFKKQAVIKTDLYDSLLQRDVLALDQIESEDWTFTFNKDGVLKEVRNQIYHALSAVDNETFMDVANKTELESYESDDLNPDSFKDFFEQAKAGELKEGDAFEIKSWK